MLARLLDELQRDAFFRDSVAGSRLLPARSATHAAAALRPDLQGAVERLCPGGLYTHQAEAVERARRGENVVIATPTASGKTMCFNLPVLESVLDADDRGETRHALYLFPLKALEQDQLKNLFRMRDAIGLHESLRFRKAFLVEINQEHAFRAAGPGQASTHDQHSSQDREQHRPPLPFSPEHEGRTLTGPRSPCADEVPLCSSFGTVLFAGVRGRC